MAIPSWGRARAQLVIAAFIDALGLVGFVALFAHGLIKPQDLQGQKFQLALLTFAYCSFGWLFGSYTLIKLRNPRWPQALLRLSATCLACILLSTLIEWTFIIRPSITVFHWSIAISAIILTGFWSAAIRLLLRRLTRQIGTKRWLVLASSNELSDLKREWERRPTNKRTPKLTELDLAALETFQSDNQSSQTFTKILRRLEKADGLAITPAIVADPQFQDTWERLAQINQHLLSIVELAEQELERIPPQWVDRDWLLFSRRFQAQQPSPSMQLKRYADVLLSMGLLIITSPLWLASAIVIRFQDGGPILYRQQRTGLLGGHFNVLKFRTMVVNAEAHGAQWSHRDDARITWAGKWLRKTRIDELPQLLNVLRGDMSLIGPRPERPELETELEQQIPNYRLRHWIRPGLSGWAQVNMPYGAGIEYSRLKLSYDLYYLRNSSPSLDFLILAKTIKTILKANGR